MIEKDNSYYENYRNEMLLFIPASAKKILEVGCGEGRFSLQIKNKNTELWGLEPDQRSAEIAKGKLFKVIHATLEEAIDQLPNKYFDAIIFNDVLEHMFYPKENLKLLRSKLSTEGRIVASIPNIRYIKNLYLYLVKGTWEYTESGIMDYTHFRFFTKKSNGPFFKDCGYEIETMKGITGTKSIKYQLLALLISLLTLRNQFDTLYLQMAVVAKVQH